MKKLWLLLLVCMLSQAQPVLPTREIRTGATLPATCNANPAGVFVKIGVGAGTYYCSSTNTWSLLGGAANAMTQAVQNSEDDSLSVGVGTSGWAFEKTPAKVAPATGNISTPGNLALGVGGTTPWYVTGYTDDVAPAAPGTANQFTMFFDRTAALPSWILYGGTQKYVANGDSAGASTLAPTEVYGSGWNGDTGPPQKDALWDKIETLSGGAEITDPLDYFFPFGHFEAELGNYGINGQIWQAFRVPVTMTVGSIIWYTSVAAIDANCTGGTCGLRIYIYNVARDTVLAATAAITGAKITSTGWKSEDFAASAQLTPGVYFLAVFTDSLVQDFKWATLNNNSYPHEMMNANATRIGRCANGFTGNGATIAAPASCGTFSASSDTYGRPPMVMMEP